MKSAKALWEYVSRHGLKPLPKTLVSVWADTYRMLSNTSAEPGRWKTSRAPYQKDIMDAFTQPGIHRVVVKSCAQIGKSDIMNNVIGRFAHLDPCTIMMIQPTIEMAQDFSKTRIAPMIRDTRVLRDLFLDVKTRDSNNTILNKIFPGGRLVMAGANSPAGLASRPVRILLCDEVDRFPASAGTEGDPIDLAAKRMTTYWNRVMGMFSTPTNEGASRIDVEYEAGTQEEWCHRCPNCGEYSKLKYTDMDVDAKQVKGTLGRKTYLVKSVKWRCPHCGFKFTERQMKQAPQKYVSTNPEALENGCRSFFINAFSSPWISWKEVMREWLEAKGDPEREKVIKNTRFGESYAMPKAFEDEDIFMRRRERYGAELPDGVLLLTASVDTQDNRIEYEVCGWGVGEESWGIRKGIILGSPGAEETWEQLDMVLDHAYSFKDGRKLKVVRTFIDSGGHFSSSVYAYCRKNFAKERFAIKGYGGIPGMPLYGNKLGRAEDSTLPLVRLGVDDGKEMVMARLSITKPGPKYFHFPLDEAGIAENRGYDSLYFKGIISEHKKKVRKNGIIREVWEPTQGVRNEPLDLRVYNLACIQSIPKGWEEKSAMALEKTTGNSVNTTTTVIVKKKKNLHTRRQVDIW